jgi:hypothetical protein
MPLDDKEITWHSMPPDDIKLHGIQCHLIECQAIFMSSGGIECHIISLSSSGIECHTIITWHSMPPDDIKLHGIQCHLMT